VSVYIPFFEAYFKLATLELDNAQWLAASCSLSRAAGALHSMSDAISENLLLRERIRQYQTECFSHMHNAPLRRHFGLRTLKFYPDNQFVSSYLAALPWPSRKVPA
jgi:hypothetical protein